VVVLLAALVYTGDIVLVLPSNKKFDAGSFEELVNLPLEDLLNFKHIEQPKEWNLPALQALFELLGLAPGMARLVTQGKDEPVQELQAAVARTLERVVLARQRLQDGIYLWGQNLLPETEREEYGAWLDSFKEFLESLQSYSSAGRLKNLRYDAPAINAQRAGLEVLSKIESLVDFASEIAPVASYLSEAERVLPASHPWVARVAELRAKAFTQIRLPADGVTPALRQEVCKQLLALKKEYIQSYVELHTRARLGVAEDKRKGKLLQDERLNTLRKLATIDLMPAQQLADFQDRLAGLKSCFELTEQEIPDPILSRPSGKCFRGSPRWW